MKKILKITFSVLFVLLVTLITIPYLLKDDIEKFIKEEINNSVNAKIDYQKVSLSLLKDFPNLHVSIDNISVEGIEEFDKIKLAQIDNFSMSLNAKKLLVNEDLEILKIAIDGANVNIKVLKNGKANYDIAKSDNNDNNKTEKEYTIRIKSYSLTNSNISYDDEATKLKLKMLGINHTGTGEFSGDNYQLDTQTYSENFDVVFDNIHYINKAKTNIDMKMFIENNFSKYTMKDIDLQINDLNLQSNMMFELKADDIDMDISYKTKQNELRKLLSLVPKYYLPDMQNIETKGTADLSGFVKGTFNEANYPAFGVNFNIKDGYIKYPDLSESVNNVNASSQISFPGGKNLDKTSINLPKIHFTIAQNTVDGRLKIHNPMTDPYIDAKFLGKIDFSKIKKALHIPEITKLEGLLDADLLLNGQVSAIEKQNYDKFKASGFFNLTDLKFASDSLPYPIDISKAQINVSPKALSVNQFELKVGESDFNIKGSISNYISYFLKKDKLLKADFSMFSNYLNMNEFMSEETSKTESPETTIETIKIPKNIEATFAAKATKVKYDNMMLNDVKGSISVHNQKAELSTVLMKTLDGQLELEGTYDTSSELAKSSFGMKMKKLSILESANTFSSFNNYAPVLKKIKGKFFSDITMQVDIDNKMSPIFNTMNASGNFNTDNIKVKGIDVLQKIAGLVKIPELNEATIDQIKAKFTIDKGNMDIKPFSFKLNDMNAQLGGKVNLDKQIDLTLNLDIPKDKLGTKANQILSNLIGNLDKIGLKAELPQIIKMQFKISGDFIHPKIKPIISGYESGSTEEIITKVVTDKVNEVIDDGKEKISAEMQQKADQLIQNAQKQADNLIAEAEKQGDNLVIEAKKAGDKLKNEAKKQGDELIKKAGNDFIKKMAAKKLAEKLNKEAAKNANKLSSAAQNKRKLLIDNAKQKGMSLINNAKNEANRLINKTK